MESVDRSVRPFRVGAIVPWSGHLHRVDRYEMRGTNWVYWLTPIERAPWRSAPAIPHADVILGIEKFARFKVGDEAYIDQRFIKFPIVDRKWSFKLGTVLYGMRDRVRPVIKVWKQQEILLHAASWHQRVLDTPPGRKPEAYSDLDHVL
ncbi:MAG: hypothetical protein KA791_01665 [Flavobacteriales bacterium]|nr:hypothetical protein [Flavobacteriales bacterium]